MRNSLTSALALLRLGVLFGMLGFSSATSAFCGFYVGKADSTLFNKASQVIMSRDGERTVISMANDYQGDLTEFALVVPVPTVLARSQINVGDPQIFSRIDAYSAPRLAEYFDENPCERRWMYSRAEAATQAAPAPVAAAPQAKSLGVKVEAQYTVGEYDIVILSAKQSDGLETWLTQNGYKIPRGAARALKPYIMQDMKFFVAKINLKEQAKTGFTRLRPLQFAFEYERFMLPIRLGMINAQGPQDLIIYMLTKNGRVESSNYRTVKLPANMDLPIQVRSNFHDFYKTLFDQQAKREGYRVVFTEYFWDMSWCDPCAAEPLTQDELRKAGVWWVGAQAREEAARPMGRFSKPRILPPPQPSGGAQPVMLTRLHVRYTPETFPEDLMFTQTKDRENFQTRYVLRHPYEGEANCPEAKDYYRELGKRQEEEAQTLARLTGWDINTIRRNIKPVKGATPVPTPQPTGVPGWWSDLWN